MNKPNEHSICRPKSLTLYHYGELDADERRWMDDHLQECADCCRELAQLESTLEMLPKGEMDVSNEAIRSLNERVSRGIRPGPRPSLRPMMGWSFAAATALFLAVILHSPAPMRQLGPSDLSRQAGTETDRLPDPALLMNLDLLENLDLLQELEGTGASG